MANSTLRASCTAANGNTQFGDSAEILIDGSDTPVTANGLVDYAPTPGDRLLVQQVGGQIEIVQFLTRGTVPYLGADDLASLNAAIDVVQTATDVVGGDLATLNQAVSDAASTYQVSHPVLGDVTQNPGGLGPVGIQADQIWVGDTLDNTVKKVPISAFVQALLGDGSPFQVLTDLGVGDVAFSGTVLPPMTTFYNYLTTHGVLVVAGKDFGA